MSDIPAIEVKNLSKSYLINHKNKASYSTLKDDFGKLVKHPFRKDATVDSEEIFWALDDISFEVKTGEIFGIIGRNGSGKSTLLKILSRIVEPTKGEAILRGRVASLLEVGTGFNPELTGRENIFFNGSMMGMSKREIAKKFNEIVWFSEVEKFLDTPVKFYSSGMYVRLAFSVAAHLEPDILILDEVLAVGDASFQKKSLNKILDTMHDGRTVLFVSHGMGSVQQLCSRGILLDGGKISFMGSTEELVNEYNEKMLPTNTTERTLRARWDNDGAIEGTHFDPISMYVTDEDNAEVTTAVPNNIDHYLNLVLDIKEERKDYTIGFSLHNQNNTTLLISAFTDTSRAKTIKLHKGRNTLTCKLPKHFLNSGDYKIVIYGGTTNSSWSFDPESLQNPSLEYRIEGGLSDSPVWRVPRSGYVAPILEWRIK